MGPGRPWPTVRPPGPGTRRDLSGITQELGTRFRPAAAANRGISAAGAAGSEKPQVSGPPVPAGGWQYVLRSRIPLAAGAGDAGVIRENDGLDTITQAELHKQTGDMRLDRGFADNERGGDLGVRHSRGDEPEHV